MMGLDSLQELEQPFCSPASDKWSSC